MLKMKLNEEYNYLFYADDLVVLGDARQGVTWALVGLMNAKKRIYIPRYHRFYPE